MSAMKSRMSVSVTLVGVGSVSSDGSPDEKESEELRLQRQQVNDSSPLLASLMEGRMRTLLAAQTGNMRAAAAHCSPEVLSHFTYILSKEHHCHRFLSFPSWNNNHRFSSYDRVRTHMLAVSCSCRS